jgi:2-dehydropantoate 2-reductase
MDSVVIVGAGAMGCLFAARLAEGGVRVTLVDVDRPRLDAIGRDGITVDDDLGVRTVPVSATTAAELRDRPDLVLLFTKGLHSAAAARSVAHIAGPDTYALTLQNGIGNAEILAETFAAERVLLGVTALPSNLDGPTQISSHGAGYIALGALRPEGSAAANRAAELLRRGQFDVRVDEGIEVAVWEKVAFNAALNPLGAITGLTNGAVDNPEGRRIALAVVAETVATAAAKGVRIDEARIRQQVDHALANHRDHRASMLQDRLAGRQTEIESINGAIVREADSHGVAAPVTRVMADLMCLIDRAARERAAS